MGGLGSGQVGCENVERPAQDRGGGGGGGGGRQLALRTGEITCRGRETGAGGGGGRDGWASGARRQSPCVTALFVASSAELAKRWRFAPQRGSSQDRAAESLPPVCLVAPFALGCVNLSKASIRSHLIEALASVVRGSASAVSNAVSVAASSFPAARTCAMESRSIVLRAASSDIRPGRRM